MRRPLRVFFIFVHHPNVDFCFLFRVILDDFPNLAFDALHLLVVQVLRDGDDIPFFFARESENIGDDVTCLVCTFSA